MHFRVVRHPLASEAGYWPNEVHVASTKGSRCITVVVENGIPVLYTQESMLTTKSPPIEPATICITYTRFGPLDEGWEYLATVMTTGTRHIHGKAPEEFDAAFHFYVYGGKTV